jgi:hypothetical protein
MSWSENVTDDRFSLFLVAQPFRAGEDPPDVGWTIAYFLSLHGVAMALSAGLKSRGYEVNGNSLGS